MSFRTPKLILLPLLLLFVLHSTQLPIQPPPLHPQDLAALLAIKASFQGPSNFFSTWQPSNSHPCLSFAGVSCSDTTPTRVTSLTFTTALSGQFPPSILNLTALTQLIFFPGKMSGIIPTNLGVALPCLRFFSITNNLISGVIPNSLSNLVDLHTLDIGSNSLSGSIPLKLLTLPNLKIVILASNGGLTGVLPEVSSPLLHLDLRGNSFTGQLPSLPVTLRYFSASSNYLSGNLESLSGVRNLSFVDLGMNAFTGPIPVSLFSPSISLLLLNRNYLSGGMPPGIGGKSGDGWTVDLSHNRLSGEITAVLAGAERVYLNNNRFIGAVPSEYSRSVFAGTMKVFYIQHNFLTGFDFPLPPGSQRLPESVSVCLSYNCMAPPPVEPTVCPQSGVLVFSRPVWQCPVFNNVTGNGQATTERSGP